MPNPLDQLNQQAITGTSPYTYTFPTTSPYTYPYQTSNNMWFSQPPTTCTELVHVFACKHEPKCKCGKVSQQVGCGCKKA